MSDNEHSESDFYSSDLFWIQQRKDSLDSKNVYTIFISISFINKSKAFLGKMTVYI